MTPVELPGPLAAVAVGAALVTVACCVRERVRRSAAEARSEALAAELRSLERRLVTEEKLTSLGMLAAGVAHEINNPMAFVTANVNALARDLAEAGDLPPLLREYVDDVLPATLDGIQRVNAIVADLRSYSREDPAVVVEFDLNEQVRTALRIAQGQLRHRAEVVTALGRLPPAVGHPRQITQVLVNLLVNAAHALERPGTVWVTTRCDPDELTVEVRDDGVGMSPDVMDRLFQPFFTTKGAGAGTGLGLAVAHGIVRAHGGRIGVESRLGKGSTFHVHLPRGSPLARRVQRAPAPRAA